jgi:3-methylcrotonyl-CoA carboxylase alpha subunit
MFNKILIANRGEIAIRVATTARRMGIKTVAVYSDADANAAHVAACDEAFALGGITPKESYLRGEKILELAKACGAQAIHPGYGFLSENEGFAQACAAGGVVFIGPPPSAIEAMGLKSESKRLMAKAGVPLVPGYHGEDQSPALLAAEAAKIGFPVLIKASAGGGGKGMKPAFSAAEFPAALDSAKREAKGAFGDDNVLIEKYLQKPRHIEIQVFADTQGNCVYLFERDCSVQRRHQKVLEEAPAPGLTQAQRESMGNAAVAAAKAVGYVGAGTVEFIYEDGVFCFMEMNTRLQVEHPVTEAITGLDLVEWQLRVASGERLPKLQHELTMTGHAIEARVYAEDPDKGFLPSIGTIESLKIPTAQLFTHGRVRIDSGVREGDAITPFYDPMIAKLIVHGDTRTDALARMAEALTQFHVIGPATNLAFLHRVVTNAAFAQGGVDTGYIAANDDALFAPNAPISEEAAVALALTVRGPAATGSPWNANDGWWLGSASYSEHRYTYGADSQVIVRLRGSDDALEAQVIYSPPPGGEGLGERVSASGESAKMPTPSHQPSPPGGGGFTRYSFDRATQTLRSPNSTHRFQICAVGTVREIQQGAQRWRVQNVDPYAPPQSHDEGGGHLRAPMPGTVISVLVKEGDVVTAGAPLLVMEAMKMEHTIKAPAAGKVARVFFKAGEQVKEGAELVEIARD